MSVTVDSEDHTALEVAIKRLKLRRRIHYHISQDTSNS